MSKTRPPGLAAWLLRRFRPDQAGDIIAGDLLEHFQQGRSRLWYWREALVAILKPATCDLWLVARAMVFGWLLVANVLPLLVRNMAARGKFSDVFIPTLLTGILTGGFLWLLFRRRHLLPTILFAASYFCRDLYRLLIWPGIQMTRPARGPALYYVTWLYWTSMDLVFIAGVLAAGITLALFDKPARPKQPAGQFGG
jgi:hypothetical protein